MEGGCPPALAAIDGRERARSPWETAALALGERWDRCHGLVRSSSEESPPRCSPQPKPAPSCRCNPLEAETPPSARLSCRR